MHKFILTFRKCFEGICYYSGMTQGFTPLACYASFPRDLLDSHILNLPVVLINRQLVAVMPYFSLKRCFLEVLLLLLLRMGRALIEALRTCLPELHGKVPETLLEL